MRKEVTVNVQASTQTETKEQSASDLSKERPKSLADVINLKPYLPGKKTAQAPHPVVETTDSIEMGMFQSLAAKVQRRYVPTTEPMEVALAVDPELKEGNKLAESGQWKEALNSWTKAR